MIYKTVPTYAVSIYMAGDIETAKRLLRQECYECGLCVTVDPTTYIYTGGEEQGFVVGMVNYPRFPSDRESIWSRAKSIAEKLIGSCCQWSALLVAPDKTEWMTCRPEELESK
jgi:Fe-S-cluster-containing hydrogenase component 2